MPMRNSASLHNAHTERDIATLCPRGTMQRLSNTARYYALQRLHVARPNEAIPWQDCATLRLCSTLLCLHQRLSRRRSRIPRRQRCNLYAMRDTRHGFFDLDPACERCQHPNNSNQHYPSHSNSSKRTTRKMPHCALRHCPRPWYAP